MQKTSSWADEADNENEATIADLPAPPPASNPWKVKSEVVEPKKFVFGDFEVDSSPRLRTSSEPLCA